MVIATAYICSSLFNLYEMLWNSGSILISTFSGSYLWRKLFIVSLWPMYAPFFDFARTFLHVPGRNSSDYYARSDGRQVFLMGNLNTKITASLLIVFESHVVFKLTRKKILTASFGLNFLSLFETSYFFCQVSAFSSYFCCYFFAGSIKR